MAKKWQIGATMKAKASGVKPAATTPNTRRRRKHKVHSETWPRIREKSSPSGGSVYEVDARMMVNGEKTGSRQHFDTLDEAEFEAQRLRDRHRMHGRAASMSASSMTDAEFAFQLLQRQAPGVTLTDAVKAYIDTKASIRRTATLDELSALFLAEKKTEGASKGYLKDIKLRLDHLSKSGFGDRKIHELTGDEMADWITLRPVAAGSKANYRRVFDVFFNYATTKGYAARNPLEKAPRPKIVKTEKTGILSVDDLTRLLSEADERIVPALAIAAFAGLRPESEILPLQWDDVNLERIVDEDKSTKRKVVYKSHGFIHVKTGATKMRGDDGVLERYVTVTENLWHWLIDRKPPQGGRVVAVKKNYVYELRQAAVAAAKIKVWPHDALRHSYGSYHFAAFRDERRTMAELGHSNPRTFRRHYYRAIPQTQAEPYWDIMPSTRGERKIVPLARAS
jgi:integrase